MRRYLIITIVMCILILNGCGEKEKVKYTECTFNRKEYGDWRLINSQSATKDHQQMLSLDGYEITNEFSASVSVEIINTVNLELGYNLSISSLKCAGTSTYIDSGQTVDFYCRPVYDIYDIVEVKYADTAQVKEKSKDVIEFGQLRAGQYGWVVYDSNNNVIEDTRDNPILVDENGEIVDDVGQEEKQIEEPREERDLEEERNKEQIAKEENEQEEIPSDSIGITEQHIPNDVATSVSWPSWNIDEDYGIDGNRYGSGLKVTISNMFTSYGSGVSNEITSRMMIPISEELQSYPDDEKRFTGIFVLDQTMYGSDSSGTIRILINNEEVFTTGKINGETLKAFPYDVSYAGADSIFIEANVVLRGTSFVFGIVSPKE